MSSRVSQQIKALKKKPLKKLSGKCTANPRCDEISDRDIQ